MARLFLCVNSCWHHSTSVLIHTPLLITETVIKILLWKPNIPLLALQRILLNSVLDLSFALYFRDASVALTKWPNWTFGHLTCCYMHIPVFFLPCWRCFFRVKDNEELRDTVTCRSCRASQYYWLQSIWPVIRALINGVSKCICSVCMCVWLIQ